MKLQVTANDALCFGRGKTTNTGEVSFGSEMFPPYPSVFLGAMRSAFLSQNPEYILDANEVGKDPTLDYKLAFYTLTIDNKLYFPAPSDTYIVGDSSDLNLLNLTSNDYLSSHRLDYYLWADHDGKVLNSEGRWICLDELRNYLQCKSKIVSSVKLSDYITREIRVGIAMNNECRATSDSMLYSASMTRTVGIGFAVELLGGNMPLSSGFLHLGKYGKTAKYEEFSFGNEIEGVIGETGMFKLYFATPAILGDGSVPVFPNSLPKVKLIAMAVTGYESIGGYDMKANRPKPMKRAVKAGSVYYYKLTENTEENRKSIINELHGKCVLSESVKAGLGLSYIGKTE